MTETVRIDELDPASAAETTHKIPAMIGGAAVFLTVGQILALLVDGASAGFQTLAEIEEQFETLEIPTSALVDGILSADATGRAKMADGFVTAAKIADAAISAAKLINGALSADATGRAKMADGFITLAKLAAEASPLGISQTWQNMSGSRANNTTYTNSTGRPIMVNVGMTSSSSGNALVVAINGTNLLQGSTANASGQVSSITFVVPPGATYLVTISSFASITNWAELR